MKCSSVQKHDVAVGLVLQCGCSGKTRTQHNANGEGIHIASGLGRFGLGARSSTRRKTVVLRLGERDVKGGEDDWEGEGELHVCSN